MTEEEKQNLAEFKQSYINLALETGKEFAAILMPIQLSDEDVANFTENTPDEIEDEFMRKYMEMIKKHKIMFVPQIINKELDERSRNIYEGERDTPFDTTRV